MSIALVTGGNRGLGYASSRALAKAGACVVLTGRDHDKAERAAQELRAEGLDVQALSLDVTCPSSIEQAVEQVDHQYGRLDVLVNNAGILPEATDAEKHAFASAQMFVRTFETNVFGVVAVTEAFLPLLRRSAMARIVNVSTAMGSLAHQADPTSPFDSLGVPAYRASKTAVNSITINLAKALAGTGIVVTSVCPGWVQTDLAPGNRAAAPTSADQAAQVVVRAATLPAETRSGTFVDAQGLVPW